MTSDIKKEHIALFGLVAVLTLWYASAHSAAMTMITDDTNLPWFTMVTHLLFGLAFFLHGMKVMEKALRIIAGDRMKLWLKQFTHKPVYGMVTGGVVTAIIQSSSVTTVMLVSFVSAELMTFSRAIPVLFGANIGSTMTAQLIAFKITHAAPVMGFLGFFMKESSRDVRIVGIGSVLFGLALIFFGMGFMSEAMEPLRTYEPFMELMAHMNNPWYGLLIGAVFTALVQSSAATVGLVVVMAMQGLVTIEAGIALALGANIGTCITAGLAAIGKSRPAVRVAIAHVFFNLVGSFIFVWLIPYLAAFVSSMSDDVSRQVANAHTTFNVIVAFLFLPFARHLADMTLRMLPDRPEIEDVIVKPKHLLSQKEMEQPMGSVLALNGVRKEIYRMGKRVRKMFKEVLPAAIDGNADDLDRIKDADIEVNTLHRAILHNIHDMRHSLDLSTNAQMEALGDLWSYPDLLESAADIVKDEIVKDGRDRIDHGVAFSPATIVALLEMHAFIMSQLTEVLVVIKKSDNENTPEQEKALEKRLRKVIHSKSQVQKMEQDLKANLKMARLGEKHDDTRIRVYSIEDDMIDHMRHVYNVVRKMAKVQRPHFIDIEADLDDESDDEGVVR